MRKNSRLPNLHNLGIHLRILLIVNVLAILATMLLSKELNDFFSLLAELSAVVQPIILISMLGLYGLYPLLSKLKYWQGILIIFILEMTISACVVSFLSHYFSFDNISSPYRASALAATITGIVAYYFYLQERAYSPAIVEARLQALQARIRPHFLFNSINAVLSVIRSQPKRAESALEDMADLFRVLMAENRDLVPISEEIALCRQYLNIESLRLENRLKITWQIDNMPPDALIPPLVLQPLLENAVYHGIEPMPEGGEIVVSITPKNKALFISISNPYVPENDHHSGNKMALKNIKERLKLHFDLEATLKTETKDNFYKVLIFLPYETN
ncbi:MAG: sensor histidine kinase [Methylophilaceae bacterium]